ncbi:hypothetical protein SCATT_13110 [Streptantibioticus cattleyicolor NRRL 8057 = DSM 46488]|uniref:Uncharacterized protein n=1 Tax=Streptantibioticus cattleyicolor (strain ATCC 35852 / DSM 46488 / JCM 4925 / NBRC 14057 / NRRL 8057) TaxID=1003195 RepID=G8WTN9_STREN|nr:hypothetical protein SCATT_13110 [Streptantibioticus cattleyicolor NRRL 8057 = DSM 46488]
MGGGWSVAGSPRAGTAIGRRPGGGRLGGRRRCGGRGRRRGRGGGGRRYVGQRRAGGHGRYRSSRRLRTVAQDGGGSVRGSLGRAARGGCGGCFGLAGAGTGGVARGRGRREVRTGDGANLAVATGSFVLRAPYSPERVNPLQRYPRNASLRRPWRGNAPSPFNVHV